MKQWFKYEFGYVNIDSENLYLTNSGNWSETKDMSEKTRKVANKNDSKRSSILGFIIGVLCLFGFLIYKSFINGKLGIALILITIGGGYKLYDYLKTEIGGKFRIPLDKISEIKLNGNSAEIIFINGEGDNDSYPLQRIDKKGINIINSLIDIKQDDARLP